MKIPFLFLFSLLLSLTASGQNIQSAILDYHQRALPSGGDYIENYNLSGSKLKHFSVSSRNEKKKKTRLKISSHFTESIQFLDSILTSSYYLIEFNPEQFRVLIEDTLWQKKYQVTRSDMKASFDSLNCIRMEKTFFNRPFDIPSESNGNDPIIKLRWYQLEPAVIDGTPFQLTCSVNSQIKLNYSANLFGYPPRSTYAEWLSLYLMQKKYALFPESSPIHYYFNDRYLDHVIKMYLVWKKYGVNN